MGLLKKLNRLLKKNHEPESAKLTREVEEFYKKHPKSTLAVGAEVKRIRDEFEKVIEVLQQDFDKQYEETSVVYLKRELNYLRSWLPGGKI